SLGRTAATIGPGAVGGVAHVGGCGAGADAGMISPIPHVSGAPRRAFRTDSTAPGSVRPPPSHAARGGLIWIPNRPGRAGRRVRRTGGEYARAQRATSLPRPPFPTPRTDRSAPRPPPASARAPARGPRPAPPGRPPCAPPPPRTA